MKKIALLALIAVATPVLAQNGMVLQMLTSRFAAADKDHNGKLTKAEAKDGMPRIYANFDRIDAAKRGYLTLDQIKAAAASQK